MPGDLLVILLVWLLYAFECIAWDRRDVVYFRTLTGRGWRLVRPSRLLENTVSGLALLFPVPPLGVQAPAHPPRISLSPDGVAVYVPESGEAPQPAEGPVHYLYGEIEEVRARGDAIVINDRPFARAASKGAAAGLADVISHLKSSRAKDRARIIGDHVDGLFDRSAILAAVEGFKDKTAIVFLLANLQWLCLIVGMPAFIYIYGFSRSVVPMLALVLFLHMAVTGLALGIHRSLYGTRGYSLLAALLPSPFHGVRVADLLAKKLLADHHPFAVAAALLRNDRFVPYARTSLARARHVPYAAVPDKARAIDEWYKRRLVQSMEEAVSALSVDTASLAYPKIVDADAGYVSFCPRCHGLYQTESGVCADCPDMPLVPLKKG